MALQQSEWENKYVVENSFRFPEELLLNSSDRQEVVEKDWVSKVIDMYNQSYFNQSEEERLRKCIELHAPKQKKFTKQDIEDFFYTKDGNFVGGSNKKSTYIYSFLKEHNLLSDAD